MTPSGLSRGGHRLRRNRDCHQLSIREPYFHLPHSHQNYFDAANKETNFVNWRWTVGGSPNHPTQQPVAEITQKYSGDGQPIKRIETRRTEELIGAGPNTNVTEITTTTLYLYSSVLRANVVELDGNGVKTRGYVYANGERLAKQEVYPSYSKVTWTHANAGTNSWVETGSLPIPTRQEMDPVGAEVGTVDPFISDPDPNYLNIKGQEPLYIEGGDPFDYSGGCTLDGLPWSCTDGARRAEHGSAKGTATGHAGGSAGDGNMVPVWIADDSLDSGEVDDHPATGHLASITIHAS